MKFTDVTKQERAAMLALAEHAIEVVVYIGRAIRRDDTSSIVDAQEAAKGVVDSAITLAGMP